MKINVKDYGAKGDMVANDAPAIQAALNYAATQGNSDVYLPNGAYLLDRPRPLPLGLFSLLTIQSGVNVVGEDRQRSTLRVADHLNGSQTELIGPNVYKFPQYLVLTPGPGDGPNIATTPLVQCRFNNFTIDHNGINNGYTLPALATARAGHFNWGFGTRGVVSDIDIDGVTFLNNPGMQNISIMPITGLDFSQRVSIKNCVFRNAADAIPGNTATDHSSIYLKANNWDISDNVFQCDTPSIYATAIEIYGANGFVGGNTVDKFAKGLNLVGSVHDLRDVLICDNRIRNVNAGMDMWTWSPATLRNIDIGDNTIILRPLSNSAAINRSSRQDFQLAPVNVNICCNVISQAGAIAGVVGNAQGIMLTRGDGLRITDNHIFNMTGRAIDLHDEMNDVDIVGNHITDVGQGADARFAQGIAFQMGGPGIVTNGLRVTIAGNKIRNDKTLAITTGIRLQGPITDLTVLDNDYIRVLMTLDDRHTN